MNANRRINLGFLFVMVCVGTAVQAEQYIFPPNEITVNGTVQGDHVVYAGRNLDETGFKVPSGTTVNWAVDAGGVSFTGTITIDAGGRLNITGANGQLKLVSSSITIGGTLSIENTGNSSKSGLYANGSTITLNGTMNVANSGGSEGLRLYYSTMDVAANGVFDVQGEGARVVLVGENNSVTKVVGEATLPYFIANPQYESASTITDGVAYANGFVVGKGATVVWRSNSVVSGPIIVGAGGTLSLGDENGSGILVVSNGATLQNNGTMTINAASELVLGDDEGIGRLVVGSGATLQNSGTITLAESSTIVADGVLTNNATIMNRGGITLNGTCTNAIGARLIDTGAGQLAIGEHGALTNSGMIALGVWGGLGNDGVGPDGFATNFNGYLNGVVVPYISGTVTIGGDGTYDLPASAFSKGFFVDSHATLVIAQDVTVAANGIIVVEYRRSLSGSAGLILQPGAVFNDDIAERKIRLFVDVPNGRILFLPYIEGEVEIGPEGLAPIECDHGFFVAPGARVRINGNTTVTSGEVHVLPGGILTVGSGRVLTLGRGAVLDVQAEGSVVMEGPYATLCLSDCDVFGGASGTSIRGEGGSLSGTVIFENIVWLRNIDFGGTEVNDNPANAVVLGSQDAPIRVVYRNNARVLVDGYVKIWPAEQGVV